MLVCCVYIMEDESEILLLKQHKFAVNDVCALVIHHAGKSLL